MEQRKLIRRSDTPPIPKRRIFMMCNGKPVQPRTAENFCGAIVNGCLDGDIISHYEFSLGFAACFDAISRGTIDLEAAQRTLQMLGIDTEGLDPTDRKILGLIIDKFDGGPVGITTIGAAMGEEPDTLEEVYEPYLIQKGLLSRTQRGRIATRNAYAMLHRDIPQKQVPSDQIELF